jgi:hypothetical protein
MDKITEIYLKVEIWAKDNPVKATMIGVFFVGFLVGAILL